MFSDPQSVTVDSVARSLVRTGSALDSGVFSKDDGSYKLRFNHQYGRRNRHVARFENYSLVPDVMDSSINTQYNMATYLVVDVPVVGYSLAVQKQVVDGFLDYLTASTGANVGKLLAGES
jgi:hypothetical protein